MVFAAKDRVRFYHSPDLKAWTFASEFGETNGNHGGVWECPDLFELDIEGTDSSAWVLLLSINPGGPNGGSATQYFVGTFDGENFTPHKDYELPDEQAVWLDHGRDNYAGVTWSDIPATDGRRLFIGWMSNWDYANVVPTTAWRSAMTLPRQLKLTIIDGTMRLRSIPVDELQSLAITKADFPGGTLLPDAPIIDSDPTKPFLVELKIKASALDDFELHLQNTQGEFLRFGFDHSENHYFIDRSSSGPLDFSPKFSQGISSMPRIAQGDIDLHVFIDVSSIEMFADNGASVMTEIFFPSTPFAQLTVGTRELKHKGITVNILRTIW